MSKITESARGKSCSIRVDGPYPHNPDTVVHCHYPIGGLLSGTAQKSDDRFGARACYDCHRIIDGRDLTAPERKLNRDLVRGLFAQGVILTQAHLVKEGLL